jgi:hypothetical protein
LSLEPAHFPWLSLAASLDHLASDLWSSKIIIVIELGAGDGDRNSNVSVSATFRRTGDTPASGGVANLQNQLISRVHTKKGSKLCVPSLMH